MTSVDAPEPSLVENLATQSIETMVTSGVYADFYNHGAELLAHLQVRNDPSVFVKALRRAGSFDAGYRDVLIRNFVRPGSLNEKLANPGTAPAATGYRVRWSPDTRFVAVTTPSSPYFYMYERVGDTLTSLSVLALSGPATGLEWSPTGKHLWVSTGPTGVTTNYYLLSRTGTSFGLVGLNIHLNPGPPAQHTGMVRWSPDGLYVAVVYNAAPYLAIYKRATTSATTFTRLPDITLTTELSISTQVAWSPDMKYLSVTSNNAAGTFIIFKKSGDVFTRVVGLTPLADRGYSNGMEWSLDGQYLAIGTTYNSKVAVYKRSGDVFTRLPDPIDYNSGPSYTVAWTPDGRYLFVGSNGSPYYKFYKLESDVLTSVTPFATPPLSTVNDAQFSLDGKYLALALSSSPYFAVHKSLEGPVAGAAVQINPEATVAG